MSHAKKTTAQGYPSAGHTAIHTNFQHDKIWEQVVLHCRGTSCWYNTKTKAHSLHLNQHNQPTNRATYCIVEIYHNTRTSDAAIQTLFAPSFQASSYDLHADQHPAPRCCTYAVHWSQGCTVHVCHHRCVTNRYATCRCKQACCRLSAQGRKDKGSTLRTDRCAGHA
jgi:hypothetical protein